MSWERVRVSSRWTRGYPGHSCDANCHRMAYEFVGVDEKSCPSVLVNNGGYWKGLDDLEVATSRRRSSIESTPSSTSSRCSTIGNVTIRHSNTSHPSGSNCRWRKTIPPDFKSDIGNRTPCRSTSPGEPGRFMTGGMQ